MLATRRAVPSLRFGGDGAAPQSEYNASALFGFRIIRDTRPRPPLSPKGDVRQPLDAES